MSTLPYEAVDRLVLANIETQGSTVKPDSDVYGCGCQYLPRDRKYRLCRYHDGMNDGLAMASAPPGDDGPVLRPADGSGAFFDTHCPRCLDGMTDENTNCDHSWHDRSEGPQ